MTNSQKENIIIKVNRLIRKIYLVNKIAFEIDPIMFPELMGEDITYDRIVPTSVLDYVDNFSYKTDVRLLNQDKLVRLELPCIHSSSPMTDTLSKPVKSVRELLLTIERALRYVRLSKAEMSIKTSL